MKKLQAALLATSLVDHATAKALSQTGRGQNKFSGKSFRQMALRNFLNRYLSKAFSQTLAEARSLSEFGV